MHLNGIEMIENKILTKGTTSIPKRRNRNKRIQKKWNKKYGYFYLPIPDPQMYFFDGKFIGHPLTIKKIIKLMNKGVNHDRV